MSVSPATQKRSRPAPEPILSTVRLPVKPSSSKRCFMRSVSGKTVEEPAVMMSPETASGAYIASGSSAGASVGGSVAGISAAGTSVGSASVGAGAWVVAGAQAASTKLITTKTNINERTNLVISFFSLIFIH